jgi:hypothetical protein
MRLQDARIDWLTMLAGSASGYLSGSAFGQQLCRLAPLDKRNIAGLLFRTTILPVPPNGNLEVIMTMIAGMNLIMYDGTGAAVEVEGDKIQFYTLVLKGSSGFTDAQLRTLVNMSVSIGDEICRALITVHQGQVSPEQAMKDFSSAFSRFTSSLPAGVKLSSVKD